MLNQLLFALLHNPKRQRSIDLWLYCAYALLLTSLVWVNIGLFWYLDSEGTDFLSAILIGMLFLLSAMIMQYIHKRFSASPIALISKHLSANLSAHLKPVQQKLQEAIKSKDLVRVLIVGALVLSVYKMLKPR